MRRLLVTVTAVFLATGWSAPIRSEVLSLTLEVDGLACPFCAFGLEKNLKKIEGVEKLKIDIEAGRVELTVGPDVRLGDSQKPGLVSLARKAVKDGGFTARDARTTVKGIVTGERGAWGFEVTGTGEDLTLDVSRKSAELDVRAGSDYTLSGPLREGSGPITLVVERVVPAEGTALRLKIDGLICEDCADAVRAAIVGVAGVQGAVVDLARGLAVVQADMGQVTPDQLVAAINAAAMDGMPEGTFRASIVRR